MFIDSRKLNNNSVVRTGICIIGAGAAGISLAREMYNSGTDVCLLESGGMEKDEEIQSLGIESKNPDHPYTISSGDRFFGGSTNHWGGNCAPLDPVDFDKRPYVPHASWPITYSDIRPYFKRVQELCQLGEYNYEPDYWELENPEFDKGVVPVFSNSENRKIFQRNPLRFGKVYRDFIRNKKSNINVYLYATALKLVTNKNGNHVKRVSAGTIEGKKFHIEARYFVLAGGIQNARILLLSDDVVPGGIGNTYDVVGRYFMGHLNFKHGFLVERPPYRNFSNYSLPGDLNIKSRNHVKIFSTFQIPPEQQKENKIMNYVAMIARVPHRMHGDEYIHNRIDQLKSRLNRKGSNIFYSRLPQQDCHADNFQLVKRDSKFQFPRINLIRNWVEQAPEPGNRVLLASDTDRLGLRRIRLEWSFGNLEKRTLKTSHMLLDQLFLRSGIGRVYSDFQDENTDWSQVNIDFSHYMGTTRMSETSRSGVVDKNCKVHEVDNLYISGGSVLPTAGASMVTFNLLALTLRLGDHLKQLLSRNA